MSKSLLFFCIFAVEFKNENIMATITLDYDVGNEQAQKALEYILSLGLFKPTVIGKEKAGAVVETSEKTEEKPLFANTFGIWADRDIDVKTIRKEIRNRRTKHYDNATL